MIPLKKQTVIQSSLGTETTKFSIANSGKAFRTLIDGLYTNKISALIRELSSNAADAHVSAGIPEVPFDIHLPTELNTEFYIRDYGNSMSHTFVMENYSTLFFSDKTESNDQMGLYGLGSKSPFAYTDSFSVECYVDGKLRSYLCHIGEDDIPAVTFLGETETDQPNGTRISLSAKASDVLAFENRLKNICIAYRVLPNVLNKTVEFHKPLYTIDGVRVFEYNLFPASEPNTVFITQGNVVYRFPVSSSVSALTDMLAASRAHRIILDAPIGTFDVTPSREDVDLNVQSQARLKVWAEEYVESLTAILEEKVGQAKNRLAYYKVYKKYSSILKPKNLFSNFATMQMKMKGLDAPVPVDISLHKGIFVLNYWESVHTKTILEGMNTDLKASDIKPGFLYRYSGTNFNVVKTFDSTNVILITGMEKKVVRKIARIRDLMQSGSGLPVPRNGANILFCFSEDLPRFVRLFELGKDQVVDIEKLKDAGPRERNVSNATAKIVDSNRITGTLNVNAVIENMQDKCWIITHGGKVKDPRSGTNSYSSITVPSYVATLGSLIMILRPGLFKSRAAFIEKFKPVELTAKAAEKILAANPDFANSHMKAEFEKLVTKEVYEAIFLYNATLYSGGLKSKIEHRLKVNNNLRDILGYQGGVNTKISDFYCNLILNEYISTYCPQMWFLQDLADNDKPLKIGKIEYTAKSLSQIYQHVASQYIIKSDKLFENLEADRVRLQKDVNEKGLAYLVDTSIGELSAKEILEIFNGIIKTKKNNTTKVAVS